MKLGACRSIAKATVLEILSEPLSLLVLLSALALCVLAPAFHYHQFGEPERMARDAGLSAQFTGGLVLAVFGAVHSFRREIETLTIQMALAHPISRMAFFLAKVAGVLGAYLVFATILAATTLVMVRGAEIGGVLASRTGDVARIFGPCLAAGVGVILLPLVAGACANRFARCRFVLSCYVAAFVTAALACLVTLVWSCGGTLRLLPVMVLQVAAACVFIAAASAFSVRLQVNGAVVGVSALAAAALPFIGNYYLPDVLARGGVLEWSYVALASAAVVPAVAAFLLLGVRLMNVQDLS